MADLPLYSRILGTSDLDSVVQRFAETLVDTNRTYGFFVDWAKVRRNVDRLRVEIGILSSLVGVTDPAAELDGLLRRYPEVIRAIPIVVAIREHRFKVLEDVDAPTEYAQFDFTKTVLDDTDIALIIRFCERTGFASLLSTIRTLHDYVLGIEVGMDTNARKNRSGTAMEDLISPIVHTICSDIPGVRAVAQQSFARLENEHKRTVPTALRNRHFDLAVLGGGWAANIEIDFFSGGGSKPQEIVDSYIDRQRNLAQADWRFIWITDGDGWRSSMRNQIRRAFEEMDYVLNASFVRAGLLKAIISSFSEGQAQVR